MPPNPLRAIIHGGDSGPNDYYPNIKPEEQDAELQAMLLNWAQFWAQDHTDAEWIAEPILAKGRSHAIFAPGGTGKSLFALWLAVRLATGGTGLAGEPLTPIDVLYYDFEMTEADLAERLETMGYGPDTDLTRLHYALLPSLSAFDTAAGGQQVARMAAMVDAQLVVIDTFSRAVEGDENDADTTRAFYRHTGLALKAAGRAFARIDHAGKDLERGQRGSSAKNDDVDVVWQMVKADDGFTVTARKRRMGWVPETVALAQHDDPILTYSVAASVVPAGTAAVVKALDDLGVDPHATIAAASKHLRAGGGKARTQLVLAAQRTRRQRPIGFRRPVDNPEKGRETSRETSTLDEPGNGDGNDGTRSSETSSDLLLDDGKRIGKRRETTPTVDGEFTATLVAEMTQPAPEPEPDGLW